MNQTMIQNLQEAWRAALEEFLVITPTGDKSLVPNLQQVILNIRYHNLLREGKNEIFIKKVYNDIRNIPDLYSAVMSMSTAFNLELADVAGAIKFFCQRASVYTPATNVVDNLTLDRKAPVEALEKILGDNPWLFMLCFASTQERLTLRVMVESGMHTKGAK